MHLATDLDAHRTISAEVSFVDVGDNEVLPTLLNRLHRQVTVIFSDEIYYTKKVPRDSENKGCTLLIQP
ncbi:transposase [Vibrio sp. 10N.261.49.A12]|uniref:transposase n=1 Tax=Vibrio sp. 10N.261.49.A12 TaxID=3229667 RepID=UPI00354F2E34